ncbi:hypothetical protein HanXRQr2_Chr11g0504791 [Helianthus annuus]|uniref:Uncharacterized protein n=1 Tax=Helianthus annuus TaxID=4232 RepID=A0A251TBZ6_HELAN|nr:hypothetical protein HanXRQr2_Chr11g0504791 [Helianthus annuus]
MATALSSGIDEIMPPDITKSSDVEERSLPVQRISVSSSRVLKSGLVSVFERDTIAIILVHRTLKVMQGICETAGGPYKLNH